MKRIPAIAIFDIGKTNKKFFLFDEQYKIVLERTVQFEEVKDDDGDSCEDVAQLSSWVLETFSEVLQIRKFQIRAVNFSAYGASFVYINEKGEVIAPLYNYLKPFPPALSEKFYAAYGGEVAVSCETASPVLGNLNSGMQIYKLKNEKPDLYANVRFALHLPQYLNYLISGVACSDITSIGCHTQLWDFQKQAYHRWVTEEGIAGKLAPLFPANEARLVRFEGNDLFAGTGLHDSSAALIPYLACFSDPFVLISTGTWCITLNPFNDSPLTAAELQQDCLCYMEYHGSPVKASRLFAGYEHEQQTKRIAAYFGTANDMYKRVKYNELLVEALEARSQGGATQTQVKAETISPGSSEFGKRDLAGFNSYEEAYHRLIMDIMVQQASSTKLVLQHSAVNRIFVDGGFGNNTVYMHLLAAAFPQHEIYAASVAQATAVGAALAIHKHWNQRAIPGDMIQMQYYSVVMVNDYTSQGIQP